MAQTWQELFITGEDAPAAVEEAPEQRQGFFRRLRENLSKTREALGAELQATVFQSLDDLNIDRFLQLIGRFSDRAQFIVVTHQKRTMDAADVLYGVSMGGDGVSKVVSRRLPQGKRVSEAEPARDEPAAEAAA